MLELINLSLPLEAGLIEQQQEQITRALAREFKEASQYIDSFYLRRLSVDARKKSHISFTASIAITSSHESQLLSLGNKNLRPLNVEEYCPRAYSGAKPNYPPLVVGAGCAGLFAALVLAQAGLCPIVLERGQASLQRTKDIDHFNKTGILNTESNIQFGLGGAGTFSDGKLTTNTSSLYHNYIKKSFVAAGAPQEILWKAKPHIGSDLLPSIVQELAKTIESFGGQIIYGAKMTAFQKIDSSSLNVLYEHQNQEKQIKCSRAILASGHSARKLYEYLDAQGVLLERKKFAMGLRIEHLQSNINKAQYGRFANHPALGAADYKLVAHINPTSSAYTFCMCPGGEVVNASSEPGMLCTNGMSNFARDGQNANAGFLVGINPEDLEGPSVLAGMHLQRSLEAQAFQAGGTNFQAPIQLLGDFLHNQSGAKPHSVQASFPQGYQLCNLRDFLPEKITNTLVQAVPIMARKLNEFDAPDAVLTAIEARSSSPVRIVRDPSSLSSISHPLIIPCGEGAGYAGGIMSAAADGVRCAEALMQQIS